MDQTAELEIRKAVRERYSKIAAEGSCSSEGSCCNSQQQLVQLEQSAIPQEALSISAGCGSPLELISPKLGQVVLDLGSGGGIDVFRASDLVGENGRAIGVDSTPEMLWKAREIAESKGYKNVEFRLGEIEHLPIESQSVDYVISNCVINLSPNKQQVLREAFRVLKPSGVFAVADITRLEAQENIRDLNSWCSCFEGAITEQEYRKLLEGAGFESVKIEDISSCPSEVGDETKYFSSHIKATRP